MTQIVGLAGGVVSMAGNIEAGKNAEAADRYNAAVNERNAAIALDQGDARARQAGVLSSMRIGAARANIGAAGVTQEGSPMDVLEFSASQAELQKQNIKYDAKLRSIGYMETARADERRARTDRSESYFNAGSSLLHGAASGGQSRRGAGTPLLSDGGGGDEHDPELDS